MTTPIHALPEIAGAGASGKEETHNEANRLLEQGANFMVFQSRVVTAQPASPSDGQCWILPGAGVTGADWAGHEDQIARYINTEWVFLTPFEGLAGWVSDEDVAIRYDGVAWGTFGGGATEYIFSFFFTFTPEADEVLLLHVVGANTTIPADFTDALESYVGTNPSSSFALDMQKNGTTIGTITVSTGGVVSATTDSGAAQGLVIGDVVTVLAPSPADLNAANMAFTIIGDR